MSFPKTLKVCWINVMGRKKTRDNKIAVYWMWTMYIGKLGLYIENVCCINRYGWRGGNSNLMIFLCYRYEKKLFLSLLNYFFDFFASILMKIVDKRLVLVKKWSLTVCFKNSLKISTKSREISYFFSLISLFAKKLVKLRLIKLKILSNAWLSIFLSILTHSFKKLHPQIDR